MIRRPELLAAELRRALDLLGGITGAISPDEIIGRIFSRFCIGK
jgi:tRNA modification GTPase